MPTIGSIPSRVPISDLKGTAVPQNETKVAQTPSHTIQLASAQGHNFLPDFKIARRVLLDPEAASRPKLITATGEEAAALSTGDLFSKFLNKHLLANKDHLLPLKATLWARLPEADRTQFAYNNIVGQRAERFFGEATKLLATTTLSGPELALAKKAINKANNDLFRNRNIEFDRASTGTYWSYGHDVAFVHVFEKMRDALSSSDPKRLYLQKQIDFIYTNKFVIDGQVDENDAERSLKLMAIDEQSRHVVSLSRMSQSSTKPMYVTLQIPTSAAKNGGRFAYRDGDNFYFDDTKELMKPVDIRQLREMFVSKIVLRPPTTGERPRAGLRYDWDRDGITQLKKIETGWWGHCDIKATLETLLADMAKSGGVVEFNSSSAKTAQLSRADLLEALAATFNFENEYREAYPAAGEVAATKSLGDYQSAGGRFDDAPDQLRMMTPAGAYRFNMRLTAMSEKGQPEKSADIARAFSTKIPDARMESFQDNPEIVETSGIDTAFIDISKRKFSGKTQSATFDESGNATDLEARFEIDPAATTGERVLIASTIESLYNRTTSRIYYEPKVKELFEVPTSFVLEGGKYKATEGTAVSLGAVSGWTMGHETRENDDVANKLKMIQEAIRSGDKIAADSDTGSQVWNGEVHTLGIVTEYRSPDGKWERIGLFSDATYGANKVGTIINKLNEEGNIIDCCEIKSAVDFFWKSRPQVAPFVFSEGKWFASKALVDRGVLSLGEGRAASLAALQDVYDMIYLGFKATDYRPIYTIMHEGKRLMYKDHAQWSDDVRKLGGIPLVAR